jgi:AraC-like DNA-binding protein
MSSKVRKSRGAPPNLPAEASGAPILPSFYGYTYRLVDTACTFSEHVHHDHQVIFVDVGHYHCTVNGIVLELEANELLVVKPGDRHADSFVPPLRCIAINFSLVHPAMPDRGQSLFADFVRPEQQVVRMSRETIMPLITRMREETDLDDAVGAMIRDALLREFFWRMVRAFGPDVISSAFMRSSDEHSWYLKLRQLLRANRGAFVSVPEMAESVGVSERTLTNLCRRILNESPSRALMNYKMDEAMAMVTQTSMTVQQISHTLGFSNPYHFSQAFKRRFGISPLNVRLQK